MSCAACFSGARWEGEPEGTIEKIGGIECYVSTPKGDYAKDKVVLFLSDAFGLALNNNKVLSDDFARNGFKTVVPDLFNGDPVPENALSTPGFDFMTWFGRHQPQHAEPIVDAVVRALKESGVTRIATTAYCYGALFSFKLALEGHSQVTVLSHPSGLKVPEDLERYKAEAKAPLLINGCERDSQFPREAQTTADSIFGEGKFAPGYESTYWPDADHGFAVRGDVSKPSVKAAKEGSFKATVEFLHKYL